MNSKFFKVALGIALSATVMSASAQKKYTQGVIMESTSMNGQDIDGKEYFTPDSIAFAFQAGPASIKLLSNTKHTFFAVLVDVPVASIKKAGISTPAEIEQTMDAFPKLTFAPTSETKVISGFNCKKVIATDTKTSSKYDVWVTNDVTLPTGLIPSYLAGAGGFPIQYTAYSQGQSTPVTVKSISADKVPAGMFSVSPDYDKITMDELRAMSGGR